jgi:hypothetical protein
MASCEQAGVRRTAIALCCLFFAGCAAMDPEPSGSGTRAASAGTSAEPIAVPEVTEVRAMTEVTAAPAAAASAPAASAAPALAAAATPPPPPQPSAPVAVSPSATPPAPAATAATAPAVTEAPPRVATPVTPPPASAAAPPAAIAARPAAAAPLDFSGLGTRLRQTKAIGVLTKISVKNEADDLLEEFRAYHTQQNTSPTLTELRNAYDSLLGKLLSLLQDGDPPLAKDIDSSRTAIWDVLVDPKKFVASNLMAGA